MHDEAYTHHKLKGSGVESGGTGRIVIDLGGPRRGSYWQIERVAIESNSTGAPIFKLYVGSEDPLNLEDFSDAAANDISDNLQAIYVPGGASVIGVFSAVSAGARAWINASILIVDLLPPVKPLTDQEIEELTE